MLINLRVNMERIYKRGEINSFRPNPTLKGKGPQISMTNFELGLGEMIRMARLNDTALSFASAKQAARLSNQEEPSITDRKYADLKYHPRYKRQFKGERNG
jgi:hypothetical protein